MAPVGSYESLVAAVAAGANSVYFGIGALNMRAASAANFGADDMAEIVEYAHSHGVKAYLTVNTIVYEEEIALMRTVLDAARDCGVDAGGYRVCFTNRLGGAYLYSVKYFEQRDPPFLLPLGRCGGAGKRVVARQNCRYFAQNQGGKYLWPIGRTR